jgi:hypothetical protein
MQCFRSQYAKILLALLVVVACCWKPTCAFVVAPDMVQGAGRFKAAQLCHQQLLMGKGFNSAKNKQQTLAQKMELAKQQKEKDASSAPTTEQLQQQQPQPVDDNPEAKKRQEALSEFAQLLARNPPPKPSNERTFETNYSTIMPTPTTTPTSSKNKPKVNAKVLKKRKKAATDEENAKILEEQTRPLQLGDKARRRDFEALVSVETATALGPMAAAQLVPWVPPFLTQYLIVLADPRQQSAELHATIPYLAQLEAGVRSQVMVVTADTPEDTKAYVAKTMIQVP